MMDLPILDMTTLKAKGYCKLPDTDILHPEPGCVYSAVILGSQLVKQGKGRKSFTVRARINFFFFLGGLLMERY